MHVPCVKACIQPHYLVIMLILDDLVVHDLHPAGVATQVVG